MSPTAAAKTLLIAALIGAGLTGAAFARDQVFVARLAAPVAEQTRVIALDTLWSCEADACRAVARHDASVRACRQFVREAGQAVTAYGPEGAGLNADEIARCNGQTATQEARN
jgi:tRNA C32,U32 (ribose-2'-O)-methylase TrmJ